MYLALQVRRNTLALHSQTHYLATSALAETAAFIGADKERARVYRIGLTKPQELNEDEWMQFALFGISQFRRYENLFFQHRAGLVNDDFWQGHRENMVWFYHRPGNQIWWKEKRLSFSKSFREFLESTDAASLTSPAERRV